MVRSPTECYACFIFGTNNALYTYTLKCTHTHTLSNAHTHTQMHTHTHKCTHTLSNAHTHSQMHTHTHSNAHTHIHSQMHTHTKLVSRVKYTRYIVLITCVRVKYGRIFHERYFHEQKESVNIRVAILHDDKCNKLFILT